MSARRIAAVAAIATLLGVGPEVRAQCVACKQALESGGSSGLIDGFFWSIILLLSAAVALSSGLGYLLYRAGRSRDGPPRDTS